MMNVRRPHAGFTIIELVIGLTLMLVVMALVSPAIANLAQVGRTSANSVSAQSDVGNALEMFRNDTRRMRAPLRGTTPQEVIAELSCEATGLRCPPTPPGGDGTCASGWCPYNRYHDIIFATPTRFGFWADVIAVNPGTEYVEWRLYHNVRTYGGPPQWRIMRTVRDQRDPNMDGLPLSTEVVAWGTNDFPVTDRCPSVTPPTQRLFCFSELVVGDGSWTNYRNAWEAVKCTGSFGSDAENSDPQPPNPFNRLQSPADHWGDAAIRYPTEHGHFIPGRIRSTISRADRISAAAIYVPSAAGGSSASSMAMQSLGAPVRSRQTHAYLTAIMCGRR